MNDVRTETRLAIHRAPWLLPVSSEPIRDGAIAVRDGRIAAIGPASELMHEARSDHPDAEVHEWDGVLLPGLVNAHSHLQYTCMSGVGAATYAGFEDWSRAFQVVYEQPHDWAESAADGLAVAIASGTTAVADIVTDAEALSVLADGGVRGIVYWELMSWLEEAWFAEGVDFTTSLLEDSGLASVGLSPHAPYSLDTAVLADLTRLSRQLGVRRHLHLAESAWEAEYTMHGRGALAEQWRRWGYEFSLLKNGGSALRPVAYAESIGALGDDMHIAHGIYVDETDRAVLRRTGTSVALCPRSNAVIGLDEAPVAAYLREGNPIAVGTDSLSSTPSLDLLGDVAALYRMARRQGYAEADLHSRLVAAATHGGARAMGADTGADRYGSLEVGALADFAVLDRVAATAGDVLAAVVETGDGGNLATIIGGEVRWLAES
jgi:cytosine/adenosine deaminase-related metal-dependent hydrolase